MSTADKPSPPQRALSLPPADDAPTHQSDTYLDAGGNKAAVYEGTQSRGGAADEASAGTPRPDGPKPQEQQLDFFS